MAKIKNTFHLGKQDKDTHKAFVENGKTRHVENLRFHTNDEKDGTGVNPKGTLLVSDETEASNDLKCIGAYFNSDKDVIRYKLASTNGQTSIDAEYDIKTNITSVVLKDTNGVLKYDKTGYITGWDEINGIEIWSEWGNNIRRINTERAKGYGVNGFTEDDITLIVKPPIQKLAISLEVATTLTQEENNIQEKILYFSYRWRYLDGEYSALAPFTKAAFQPKNFQYDYSEQSNVSMVNKFNQVSIDYNTGNERVTEIQLVFIETESTNVWIIDNFNKETLGYGHNETRNFKYNNQKVKGALPSDVLPNYFDNVPLTNKAQTMIGGRLIVSNYEEGFDIIDDTDAKIEIDYSLEGVYLDNYNVVLEYDYDEDGNVIGTVPVNKPTLIPKQTVKSNRDLEVGIVYLEDYSRVTTILTSKKNTIYIPNSKSITENSIDVILKHKPPKFATHFRFFIKQPKKNYEQILPTLFYEDGVYRWIKLEGADKDKVREGDFLIVKSDTQSVKETLIKVKVLEVKYQEKNFLQADDLIDKIVERSGTYFKIKQRGFRINFDDLDNFILETYDNTRNAYNNPINSLTSYISKAHFYGDSLNDMVSGGTYTGATDDRNRYLIQIDSLQTSAKGTVTCLGVLAGDTVTVNGLLYTAVAGVKADNTQFSIDTSDTACAFDLANSITLDARIGTLNDQTATSALGVVEITTDALGVSGNAVTLVSSNGTRLAVSGAGFLTGGSENTFKWSDDNGASFVATKVPITAGVAQSLNKGVTVTFTNDTGHSMLDEWNINARATWTTLNSSRAYGFFRTENIQDEVLEEEKDEIIQNGARITLSYNEYGRGSDSFEIDLISSGKYDNIQEWFYKEGVISEITSQCNVTINDIHFARGILQYNDNATKFTQNLIDGTMTMCIRSVEHGTGTSRVKVSAKSEVIQTNGETIVLFETEPKDQPAEIWHEIGKTYDIVGGYHIADSSIPTDVDQSLGVDLRVKLDFFNAFSYGNAVESYKIKDEFNKKGLSTGIRTSSTSKQEYKKVIRTADVQWSDVYNDDSDYNGLNAFKLASPNFINLDKENGGVQILDNANSNLLVIQEDATGLMPYNKDIIQDANGSEIVRVNNEVLNKDSYRPYAGIGGISKNPESFLSVDNKKYYTDQVRGNLIRLSIDGKTEINQYGLEYFFTKAMNDNKENKIITGFDPKHNEVLVNLVDTQNVLSFKESPILGFPLFYMYQPDLMLFANNELYAWKQGKMYKMNANDLRNNFFDVQTSSKIKFYANQEPSIEKIANAISIEGSHPWDVLISTELTSRLIPKESFTQIEDYWYSEIMGNTNGNEKSSSIFGLGSYAIVNSEIITDNIPSALSIGDYITNSSGSFTQNKVTNILPDKIILEDPLDEAISFLMYSKNQNIDGSPIRGDIFEIEMTNSSTDEVILRSVNLEVIKSAHT